MCSQVHTSIFVQVCLCGHMHMCSCRSARAHKRAHMYTQACILVLYIAMFVCSHTHLCTITHACVSMCMLCIVCSHAYTCMSRVERVYVSVCALHMCACICPCLFMWVHAYVCACVCMVSSVSPPVHMFPRVAGFQALATLEVSQ